MAEKSIGALKTSGDGIKKGTEKEDRREKGQNKGHKENVGKIKQEKWCKTIQNMDKIKKGRFLRL